MGLFSRREKKTAIVPCCIVSDMVTKEGWQVGYCYREEPPDKYTSDSGWRFFKGDESDEYSNDPNNFNICALSTVYDMDKAVLSLLDAPYGSYFVRISEDRFVPDDGSRVPFMIKRKIS